MSDEMQKKTKGAYVPPHRRSKETQTKKGVTADPTNNTQSTQDASVFLAAFTRVCCINLPQRNDRWNDLISGLSSLLANSPASKFVAKVERCEAINGVQVLEQKEDGILLDDMPELEWNATQNAVYDKHISLPMIKMMTPGEVGCAMSHVALWRQLANDTDPAATMLILEDDAVFYHGKGGRRHSGGEQYLKAFASFWKGLPSDWDIVYLGFSDRGERIPVDSTFSSQSVEINLFRPTYGFHTHAYALTQSAAAKLLSHLPVTGPLDVWLADNIWFGLGVYCGVVANEGWQGTGAYLVTQNRKGKDSNIIQSGRRLAGDGKE
jgi:GR25 family glycosyltransferase involved in LPS biosynthesis